MLVEHPRVRLSVEAAVKEIETAGVKATVADILWLAHLAEMRCQPNKADPLDDFGVPVKCGRALLHRLTVAGDIWLRECAAQWWPRPEHGWMATLSELYALAHGRDADAMAGLWNRKRAKRKILLWSISNLPVSLDAVQRALYIVSGSVDYESIDDKSLVKTSDDVDAFDWGEEIAVLCAAYKMPPEYFLFKVSEKKLSKMYSKAALAVGRPDLVDSDSATDVAFGKFRLAVKEIIRKGKAATNG